MKMEFNKFQRKKYNNFINEVVLRFVIKVGQNKILDIWCMYIYMCDLQKNIKIFRVY